MSDLGQPSRVGTPKKSQREGTGIHLCPFPTQLAPINRRALASSLDDAVSSETGRAEP